MANDKNKALKYFKILMHESQHDLFLPQKINEFSEWYLKIAFVLIPIYTFWVRMLTASQMRLTSRPAMEAS